MKYNLMKLAAVAALAAAAVNASAQQAVKTVDAPYIPPAASADALIPVGKAAGVADVIGKNPIMTLKSGKAVSAQLQEMATSSGWQLIWDAADFSIEQPVTVSSDFVKAVSTVLESANQAGSRLKATFYRGNNIVRITEF